MDLEDAMDLVEDGVEGEEYREKVVMPNSALEAGTDGRSRIRESRLRRLILVDGAVVDGADEVEVEVDLEVEAGLVEAAVVVGGGRRELEGDGGCRVRVGRRPYLCRLKSRCS